MKDRKEAADASVAQVRKPIYDTAVLRYEKYGDGLKELLDALGHTDVTSKPKARRSGKRSS